MKVLVTGGNGYLGSEVVKLLLKKGHRPIILEKKAFPWTAKAGLPVYVSEKPEEYLDLVTRGIDGVIFTSGIAGEGECNATGWEGTKKANVDFLEEVVKRTDVPLAFPSSGQVYGNTLDCTIFTPRDLYPNFYAKSKQLAEDLLQKRPLTSIFRMGTIFGRSPSFKRGSMVNKMVRDAIELRRITVTGTVLRPLISVQEAASAYVGAIEHPEKKLRNLCSIPAISSPVLAEIIARNVGGVSIELEQIFKVSGYTFHQIESNYGGLFEFIEAEKDIL